MTDGVWLVLWLGVLASGLVAVIVLHRLGLASTHARDLLHVGTGVWVLGWPAWDRPAIPIALVLVAAAGVALVPLASRRIAFAAHLQRSVTGGDERWQGLVWYTLAYAVLTWIGLTSAPFPAAAGLLALSLGDGIGGAVGRHLGRHRFSVPGAKPKSVEGSAAVAVMAALGTAVAAWWFHAGVGLPLIVVAGLLAAVVEAVSPRSTDNLTVPVAVWLVLTLAQ